MNTQHCQRLKYETGNLCPSGEKTKAYGVIADREAYTLVNIKVYLCPRCAKEMGVVDQQNGIKEGE